MATLTVPVASVITADDVVTAHTAVQGNVPAFDTGTATAVAGAATLSKLSGKITSESLTTAAGAIYTLTITNTKITAASIVGASLDLGTNSAGDPVISTVTPGAGTLVIKVVNRHASAALNGTLKISYAVHA